MFIEIRKLIAFEYIQVCFQSRDLPSNVRLPIPQLLNLLRRGLIDETRIRKLSVQPLKLNVEFLYLIL